MPTVIVTGASQGIGAAVVRAFLERGYNVVGASRNASKSAELQASEPAGSVGRRRGLREGSGRPPTPYRGYYFHILTKQGKNAPGGAKAYIVHGKMTEGFAFLAYPAEYRSSGVMTFIVNQDGVALFAPRCAGINKSSRGSTR